MVFNFLIRNAKAEEYLQEKELNCSKKSKHKAQSNFEKPKGGRKFSKNLKLS